MQTSTDKVLSIWQRIRVADPSLSTEQLDLYLEAISRWIAELQATGTFPGLPEEETAARILHLLQLDLTPYMPARAALTAKRTWASSLIPDNQPMTSHHNTSRHV